MSTVRWAMDGEFDVVQDIVPVAVTDTTPVEGIDIDLRDYPGARVLIVCTVGAYSAHGITFIVEDAADNAGSPDTYATAATRVHGTITKLSAAGTRVVSFLTNKDRPWLRVKATGDSADTDLVAGALVFMFKAV